MEAYLLALGFVVGLSGALIPGPLLVYTIAESLRKGWKTGFYVIVGHAAVEVAIFLLLLAGVKTLMTTPFFVRTVSLLGGGFMVYTAYKLHRSRWELSETADTLKYGTVTGGVVFTALNPSFTVWWATAGARLLVEGLKAAGVVGALMVVAGHWIADFSWYVIVSTLTAKGKDKVLGGYVNPLKNMLAVLMLAIGVYFIQTGL